MDSYEERIANAVTKTLNFYKVNPNRYSFFKYSEIAEYLVFKESNCSYVFYNRDYGMLNKELITSNLGFIAKHMIAYFVPSSEYKTACELYYHYI